MKKILNLLVLFGLFSKSSAQTQWQPSTYQKVPEIIDCTIGDIAVSRAFPQPHIRYCPANAVALNSMFPGAGHFYYVHEYGHILNGASEEIADLFAAQELATISGAFFYINAMLSHLYFRSSSGEGRAPGYGTPAERAERIRNGALNANSKLKLNPQSLLLYE